MIDDSKPEKKSFLEQPAFYFFAVVGVIALGVQHYSATKEDYHPSKDKLNTINVVKQSHKGFLNKLTENECYAVNIVQKFENSMGHIANTSTSSSYVRYQIRPSNYIVEDGKFYRMKTHAVYSHYGVEYFPKNVEYKCLKGGFNYTTPYYFKSRDFKELSEYNQIQLAPKLSAMTSNKLVHQSMYNACYEGKTLLFAKACENKSDGVLLLKK